MLKTAMEFLSDTLKYALELDENDISVDSLQVLQEGGIDGILLSLLNIEEESTLKNSPHHFVKEKDNGEKELLHQIPPLSLNLRVVFAFNCDNYIKSIRKLSRTANYFHQNSWFAPGETQDIIQTGPPGKLIMDMESLSLEQLNHIWSISGGVHYPALFYRVRLIELEQEEAVEAEHVETVKVNPDEEEPVSFLSPAHMKKHLKEKKKNGD